MNFYQKSSRETLEFLQSNESGLSQEQVLLRLKQYGLNKLPSVKAENLAIIFFRQFQSPLIYILFAASLIVYFTGETTDALIILFVLFFNAIIGSIQEGKAQNTFLALQKFIKTNALVLREGKEIIIPDIEVVPGDIIILQEGEKAPADARLLIANNLKADEAALTGESIPTAKTAEVVFFKLKKPEEEVNNLPHSNLKSASDCELPPSEQRNMVFKGTHIVAGGGKAVVTATGIETVIGKISQAITVRQTEIPLKMNIRYLSRLIIIITLGISSFVFFLGIALDKSLKEIFAVAVSLAVSVIPEGLPIVMTLVLATGVWRMSKHRALVKKLQAVEALGQARIIAVDKTGTITKNEMVIQKIYADGKFFEVAGSGYEPKGGIILEQKTIEPLNHPELLLLGQMSAFNSNAKAMFSEENSEWSISGDPTEAAMLVLAEKIGFKKDDLENESPRITDIPFDYKTKYHLTVHKMNNQEVFILSGAPEAILNLSSKVFLSGKSVFLSRQEKQELESIFIKMSQQGLRVIALAEKRKTTGSLNIEKVEGLTFVGFLGMKDGLRLEVKPAIERAISAGIKVIMITGDYKETALAVAREAGIYQKGDRVLTGQEIDELSDSLLIKKLARVSVFARVTAEHKLRIIKAYKDKGEIIAMTGDGVNDAPSLVAADLGVAMGKIGTEVAKEASDIVLLDDNFSSIISAVEEGRNIYKTIKKVILYLFSTNAGEALTIIAALLLGLPLPILAAQIIWLNLVTDGFLDVAIAMEPKETNLLAGTFEHPKKYLIDSLMIQRIIIMSLPMMLGSLFLFWRYLPFGWSINQEVNLLKAWTMATTSLAVFQWFNAWNCRSETKSIFQLNPFSNKFLLGATFIVISLHLAAVYNPLMQKILHTTALSLTDWLLIIPVAFSVVLVEEVRKLIMRRRNR